MKLTSIEINKESEQEIELWLENIVIEGMNIVRLYARDRGNYYLNSMILDITEKGIIRHSNIDKRLNLNIHSDGTIILKRGP